MAAKADGAFHLMQLTRRDPIRHFIGFGSVSGRLGSNGQADYCMASDLLCKLAVWYRTWRPEVRSIGIHWHPWGNRGVSVMQNGNQSSQKRVGDGRRRVLKTHKYSIGQSVRFTSGPGRFGANGSFKVVKLLPSDGDEQQYRIKSVGEAFERVAKESQLDRDM